MKILAIESSCDETAAAVVNGRGPEELVGGVETGVQVLSNVVVSQIDIFAEYGGVIPEVAARSHLEAILPVVHKALDDAGVGKDEIDAIAVTHTPGLLGSLLIGTLTARMLAILWKKPLYAVHHLKSHIYANWLQSGEAGDRTISSCETRRSFCPVDGFSEGNSLLPAFPEFPLLALVVSGGHTQIIYMKGHNQFEIIGTTRDDAVGECFDKVAKILGLQYPGGPSVAKCAEKGDPLKYQLPHPKVDGLDFSFSGLKTAVLRAVQAELRVPITTPSYELAEKLTAQQKADFAATFQETACEILLEKLKIALEGHPEVKSVAIAGGVSANAVLRKKALNELLEPSNVKITNSGLKVFFPEKQLAGDNAVMVGVAAYYEILLGAEPVDPYALNIAPRSAIE